MVLRADHGAEVSAVFHSRPRDTFLASLCSGVLADLGEQRPDMECIDQCSLTRLAHKLVARQSATDCLRLQMRSVGFGAQVM